MLFSNVFYSIYTPKDGSQTTLYGIVESILAPLPYIFQPLVLCSNPDFVSMTEGISWAGAPALLGMDVVGDFVGGTLCHLGANVGYSPA